MGGLPTKLPKSRLPPLKSLGTGDFDTTNQSFIVVWCDGSIGSSKNSVDDSNTLIKLTSIVNKKRQLIHAFNDVAACQEFLSLVNNVCLIVSGTIGQELVPIIHQLDQIHSIFVFCMNKPKHDAWATHYNKVRGVFTDIEDICYYLKAYFISRLSLESDQMQCDVLNRNLTIPITERSELSFVYSMCSKLLLSHLNSMQEELVDYCRREYTNDYQLALIDTFDRNYAQHDPIWWFTKDKFFQEIVNQALCTHDLYALCAMNSFIKDLDNRLTTLHRRPISNLQPLTLFFSQSVSEEKFNKINSNQGGLLCVNEFLFANTEQAIAFLFIENQSSTSINIKAMNVLFEISIPATLTPNVAYANIGTVSQFVHEKEYLFSMGSVFRIDEIKRLSELPSAWTVHLTLVDKNDAQFVALTRMIRENYLHEECDLFEAATNLRMKLSQFKVTRKLFEQPLNFNLKVVRSILLDYHMGMICTCFGEGTKAITSFRDAIKLIRSTIPNGEYEDHLCLVPFFSTMGVTYQDMGISSQAFTDAFRALGILTKNQTNPMYKHEIAAACYFNLGLILDLQEKPSEAITYYAQALKIQQKYLPANHPDLTILEHTIKSLSAKPSDGSQ